MVLVEVLVAIPIILTFLIGLFGTHNLYLKMALSNRNVIKAAQLAEEGLEVVKFLRNSSWDNITALSLGINYYPVFNSETSQWQISTVPVLIDSTFDRTVTLSAVCRDASSDIVSCSGTIDPDTLMVVSSVSWPDHEATITKSVSTYITNLYGN